MTADRKHLFIVFGHALHYYWCVFNFRRPQTSLTFADMRLWYKRNERFILPGAILVGLVGDFLMVRFIDLALVQAVLLVHAVLAGVWISIIHSSKGEAPETQGFFKYVRLFAPVALYYSFGAMFSMFLVLYSTSGSLFSSAPFLAAIAFLLIGTEVFKKQFQRLSVQIVVYFFALFSLFILVVPYVLREIGTLIFLLSGVVSVLIMWGYLSMLFSVSAEAKERKQTLYLSVAGTFLLVNILYFTNTIPPFPLSLRDVGVYDSVERLPGAGTYRVVREEQHWYERIFFIDTVRIQGPQATLFMYSSIFAPVHLETGVVHEWKRWDGRGFEVMSRIPYLIRGGRDEGFRGYTFSSRITPGLWWVTVETEGGKVIGGQFFRVVQAERVLPNVVYEL
jgi:hypothetical protein